MRLTAVGGLGAMEDERIVYKDENDKPVIEVEPHFDPSGKKKLGQVEYKLDDQGHRADQGVYRPEPPAPAAITSGGGGGCGIPATILIVVAVFLLALVGNTLLNEDSSFYIYPKQAEANKAQAAIAAKTEQGAASESAIAAIDPYSPVTKEQVLPIAVASISGDTNWQTGLSYGRIYLVTNPKPGVKFNTATDPAVLTAILASWTKKMGFTGGEFISYVSSDGSGYFTLYEPKSTSSLVLRGSIRQVWLNDDDTVKMILVGINKDK